MIPIAGNNKNVYSHNLTTDMLNGNQKNARKLFCHLNFILLGQNGYCYTIRPIKMFKALKCKICTRFVRCCIEKDIKGNLIRLYDLHT